MTITLKSSISHKQWMPGIVVAAIAVAIGLPFLFIPVDNTYSPRSLRALWDLGHVPLFASAGYLFLQCCRRYAELTYERQLLVAIFAALTTGFVIELIQSVSGGDFSLHDVYNDLLGAGFAVIWLSRAATVQGIISRKIFQLLFSVAMLFSLAPLILGLADEFLARKQFPVLADFQSPLQLKRFGGGARLEQQRETMRVFFGTEKYSGFALKYFPRNWKGYKSVIINVNNPNQQTIALTCRIHDLSHNYQYDDRYNRRFAIKPGLQKISIDLGEVASAPRSRSMDLTRIGALGCFTTALPWPLTMTIRQITLR
ncbi:MAG: hypothetical protein ACE5GZ_14345 [Gammaproteobacteria bacterium]